jgi:alcohol dehydrogenase class IV
MKDFEYFQPTEIVFGAGRVKEVGEIVARFGKRCILVTVDEEKFAALKPTFDKVKASLTAAGVEFAHFQGAIPNPTTDCITEGTKVAAELGADVALGVGGGSSMDTAKAIAVELTHDGTSWDYLWFSETQPTAEKTLPNIAVTTTSGTGSQVTQVSVLTNPATRDKSAIYNPIIYPKVALVDQELMLTVPQKVTASTGFDVFCHAFEAILTPNASPYIEMIGFEAIRLAIKHLATVVNDGSNLDARSAMAWADTLGGLSIANAGVTLPHGMGMAIGGMYPHVSHGLALALVYPAFMRYTYQSAVKTFATLGRIFDPGLESASDEEAAAKSCDAMDALLKEVGLWTSLEELGMPKEEVEALAKQCMVLPDYENNPRVATFDEMKDLVVKSYRR